MHIDNLMTASRLPEIGVLFVSQIVSKRLVNLVIICGISRGISSSQSESQEAGRHEACCGTDNYASEATRIWKRCKDVSLTLMGSMVDVYNLHAGACFSWNESKATMFATEYTTKSPAEAVTFLVYPPIFAPHYKGRKDISPCLSSSRARSYGSGHMTAYHSHDLCISHSKGGEEIISYETQSSGTLCAWRSPQQC